MFVLGARLFLIFAWALVPQATCTSQTPVAADSDASFFCAERVARLAQRDHSAFTELDDYFRQRLMSLFRGRAGVQFHDAEDLTQETFLSFWKGINELDESASVRGLLITIANRRYGDFIKKLSRKGYAKPVSGMAMETQFLFDNLGDGSQKHLLTADLVRATGALEELSRAVVRSLDNEKTETIDLLRARAQGLSYATILNRLGRDISADALANTVYHARRRLLAAANSVDVSYIPKHLVQRTLHETLSNYLKPAPNSALEPIEPSPSPIKSP